LDAAAAAAEHAIDSVLDRADFAVARRWLAALGEDVVVSHPKLVSAQLMLALAHEDYATGIRLADRLAVAGERDQLSRTCGRAATAFVHLYGAFGRVEDGAAVIEAAGHNVAPALVYGLSFISDAPLRHSPAPCGDPFDAIIFQVDYFRGRLTKLLDWPANPLARWILGPFRIATLRATGQTQGALDLYREYPPGMARLCLNTFIGPELLLDAGLVDEAREVLASGAEQAEATGAALFRAFARLAEAKLALRHNHDVAPALAALDELKRIPRARRYGYVREIADTWHGFAYLLDGRTELAAKTLRTAVRAMRAADRILELPTAATYLAEAEWRIGDEHAADAAADVALAASRRQGSNHLLLQALSDFPAVASRRLDAERGADSEWHTLGRALLSGGIQTGALPTDVRFVDMGQPGVLVDGEYAHCRVAKAYELLAFLMTSPKRRASRDVLLDALFRGRADPAARAYLRQAIHWLRSTLPEKSNVGTAGDVIEIEPALVLHSESERLEALVGQAPRLQTGGRTEALREAVAIAERGAYLEGLESEWIVERRRYLDRLTATARTELARLAYERGDLLDANRQVEAALKDDPLAENTWRLRMQISAALGDYDGVLTALQRCAIALAEIDATPSSSTSELARRLTR
jgi:DNA-binding SARP family transcriptional activator